MKKAFITFLFINIINLSFSQDTSSLTVKMDTTKRLLIKIDNSDRLDKENLRKDYKPGLSFEKRSAKYGSQKLSTTNTVEEHKEPETITKVKYYYGTNDTTYKEFEYKKEKPQQ